MTVGAASSSDGVRGFFFQRMRQSLGIAVDESWSGRRMSPKNREFIIRKTRNGNVILFS